MEHDDGQPCSETLSGRTTGPESTGGSAYRSYLLRCWEECAETGAGQIWRFSLEDTRAGQRRGFASLNELLAALKTDMAGERPAGPSD